MLPVIWIWEIQKSGRLDLLRATHGSGSRIMAQWHNVYWRTMALSIGNQAYACSQNLSSIINCNASNYHSDQRRHWQRRSTSAVCHCHHCHCLVTKSWSKAMAACILNPHHDDINIILPWFSTFFYFQETGGLSNASAVCTRARDSSIGLFLPTRDSTLLMNMPASSGKWSLVMLVLLVLSVLVVLVMVVE